MDVMHIRMTLNWMEGQCFYRLFALIIIGQYAVETNRLKKSLKHLLEKKNLLSINDSQQNQINMMG